MPESRSHDSFVVPFVISMVALFISVATSIWTLSQSRAATDALRTGTAGISGPARPSAEMRAPSVEVAQPKLILRSASASVSATGTVTKNSGPKPTVQAVSLKELQGSGLNDALGPLLGSMAGTEQKGLWCLKGGPWSIKNIATKKSGGAFVVDSSHSFCDGVFVASFSVSDGAPLAFTVNILWTEHT